MSSKATFFKTCPVCGVVYETEARNRKFCEIDKKGQPSKCGSRSLKGRRKRRAEYKNNHEHHRLRSQCHKIAVEAMRLYGPPKICVISEAEELLECHHKNLNYLDNRISNLVWIQKDLHSRVHSLIDKSRKAWDALDPDRGKKPTLVLVSKWTDEAIYDVKQERK